MIDIQTIWNAGRVRRWHSHPHLSSTDDYLDGHHARVARLWIALFYDEYNDPQYQLQTLMKCLTHDDEEFFTCDIPGPIKARFPEETGKLSGHGEIAASFMWGWEICPTDSEQDRQIHLCDKLDAWLWMLHHKPELAEREDWQAMADKLISESQELGVDTSIYSEYL